MQKQTFADYLQNRYLGKFYNIHTKTPVLESLHFCVGVRGLNVCNIIKKRLQHRCFLVDITKLLRIPFS